MNFVKMHGCGNDFVVIDARERHAGVKWSELAPKLLDRHLGVGGDQLLVVTPPSASCAAAMRIVNANGSEAEMCGNGVRAVALFLRGLGREFEIETLAGPRRVFLEDADKGMVRVAMGRARLDGSMEMEQQKWTLVNVGNPHAVALIPGIPESFPLEAVGAALERTLNCNVEVVHLLSRVKCVARVWERSVGLTQACGSGACAIFAACRAQGLVDAVLDVYYPGGMLTMTSPEGDDTIYMTGPAVTVFHGEWPIGE
jgi:diaminopimelate epimerase